MLVSHTIIHCKITNQNILKACKAKPLRRRGKNKKKTDAGDVPNSAVLLRNSFKTPFLRSPGQTNIKPHITTING